MAKGETRRASRLAAVQALYELDLSGKGIYETLAEFEAHWLGREVDDIVFQPADAHFFRAIVEGVVREQRLLDPAIDAALAKGWPLRRIEAVLRCRESLNDTNIAPELALERLALALRAG